MEDKIYHPDLPEGYYINKNGIVCEVRKVKELKYKETEWELGIPSVIFVRGFNIDNTSTFYDINAAQDAENKDILKHYDFRYEKRNEMYKDGYRDCERLDDIVCKIQMYNYGCEFTHDPFIIRTFGVDSSDNKFHVEKVRFMLDYIKSFNCKMMICTLDVGMLLDGLNTTKYAIKRLIQEERINIYFTGLGFCLNSSTIDMGGLFVDEDSVI
ncbi:hypothetical protein [Candidatus Deianiraea vastatrix]|uniref:Uncharacterized protein n=1 Tax=Candidatus Deianiraea vastatrix TaxID=2163644 RepID=A0A5B8XCM2_9RICK|nr:hypothetical protein [Candidatus Deianiraea vastatrix]QED23043.1 hypothetical protein Deia_00235 [Candidatus Deianiraea vastatrix]